MYSNDTTNRMFQHWHLQFHHKTLRMWQKFRLEPTWWVQTEMQHERIHKLIKSMSMPSWFQDVWKYFLPQLPAESGCCKQKMRLYRALILPGVERNLHQKPMHFQLPLFCRWEQMQVSWYSGWCERYLLWHLRGQPVYFKGELYLYAGIYPCQGEKRMFPKSYMHEAELDSGSDWVRLHLQRWFWKRSSDQCMCY